MKKVVKVAKIIVDVLCWILIAILVIAMVMTLNARLTGSNPSLFGYSVYRVSSGSMEPELMVGDVILSKKIDDPMTLKVGDIVTFKGKGELSGKLITHEVIVAPTEEDGKIMLQTQGVANDVPDTPIEADRLVSVMITKLGFMNVFYDVFYSPWGLLIIIGLILIVFIDELILFIKSLTGTKSAKEGDDINEIIDRLQKEKAEELLEEKKAKELAEEIEKENKENSEKESNDEDDLNGEDK